MAFVKTIQTTQAKTPLKELYQEIEKTLGFITNAYKAAIREK